MITIELNGISMDFGTSDALFSPTGLDTGTRAMLSCVQFSQTDKVLDLGCGYGIVGIYAARQIGEKCVTMADIDASAIAAAGENARLNGVPGIRILQSDGFKNIDDTGYTVILSNPPYHADFSVAKHFIEKGFNRLVIGGRMVMVTKRKDWYKNKLISILAAFRSKRSAHISFSSQKSGKQLMQKTEPLPGAA